MPVNCPIGCCGPDPTHNSLFRSEEMRLYQLFLQTEAAYSVIAELGELGLVQFKDLNGELTAYQKKYVNEVRMCDDLERILRFIDSEITLEDIVMRNVVETPEAPLPRELRQIQNDLAKTEDNLREINLNRDQLKTNLLEIIELQLVMNAANFFLNESNTGLLTGNVPAQSLDASNPPYADIGHIGIEMAPASESSMRLNFIAGTIPYERLVGFERMLWFACRGNVYLRHMDIQEELIDVRTGNPIRKCVFYLFFQGEQLKKKATKICEGYRCNMFNIPKNLSERTAMGEGLKQRTADLQVVLEKTEDQRRVILSTAGQTIGELTVKVLKTKAIYHAMNSFNVDVTQKCLIAELWCPARDLGKIQGAITSGTTKSGTDVPSVLNEIVSNETIPTFNRTTRFTSAFQSIMDAYGVARYREINPALFATITFPFIFAIMFGDCAHGVIMFGFALWMVLKENTFLQKKGDNEIWNIIFGGRYIILLMGLFSVYTGWIYNDFFSKSINLFGSAWYPNLKARNITIHGPEDFHHESGILRGLTLNAANDYNYEKIHPLGVDPIWMIALNKITFINSYKMKMSIIIGVTQMMFGLFLSLVNAIYFRKWINVVCQFIPEFIFLTAIFGYMVVFVIGKWLTHFANTNCAPNILVGFISMFLFSYENTGPCVGLDLVLFPEFEVMKLTQTILVILCGICIPWLLVAKPAVIMIKRAIAKRRAVNRPDYAYRGIRHEQHFDEPGHNNGVENGIGHITPATEASEPHADSNDEDDMPVGELIVHQCIHTIEYCLGCVSNTASYLRLWALSLAHGQLSEVLWNMILKIGLSMNSYYHGAALLVAVFPPFAILTVAVLLLMEGLSAFLHALRLHWVEFNGKFYSGDGIKFRPFTFKDANNGTLSTTVST